MDVDYAVKLARQLAEMGFEADVRLRWRRAGVITATVQAKLGRLDLDKLRQLLAFADELQDEEVKVALTDGELGLKLS